MTDPLERERGSADPCIEGSGQKQPSSSPPTEDGCMEVSTPEIHRPLDPSRPQIRLIRFEWNQTNNVPENFLETFNLDSESMPSFCALSYEWNPPCEVDQSQRTLILDGKEIKVSQTLCAAVTRVAGICISNHQALWVDALCINQSDPTEKSHQVQLMRRIYQGARFVLIWPGSVWEVSAAMADPPMPHLLEKLKDLIWAEIKKSNGPDSDKFLQTILGDNPLHRKAFESLFSITYWQRCWIVQELVLAQRMLLVCVGYCATRSTYVTLFIDILPLILGLAQISRAEDLCRPNFSTHGMNLCEPQTPSSFYTAVRIGFTQSQMVQAEGNDLLTLLLRFSSQQSTKRSDKVYSLLGIAQSRTDQTLDVDYTLNSAEVFKKTAAYIIRDSGTLDILTYAASGSRDLPTWVPDWSEDVYKNSSILRGFCLSEQAWRNRYGSRVRIKEVTESVGQFTPQISADLSSLTVTALLCDLAPVPDINRESTDHDIDEVVRQLREIVFVTLVANRTLCDLTQAELKRELVSLFVSLLRETIFFMDTETREQLSRECFIEIIYSSQLSTDERQAESQRTLLRRALVNTTIILIHPSPEVGIDLMLNPREDQREVTELQNLARQHQIHVYLPGLVYSERLPQPLKQEEYLLAILHCRTPIILRKVDGKVKNYEVVTWAYVAGCDEGLSGNFVKEWPLEEITLV